MAFQIKSFSGIAAGMINRMKSTVSVLTDFRVGSKVRTMLEAIATEMDELYQQMFTGLKEAIPVATYNSFNFSKLPAVNADGLIRVTITAQAGNALIAAGTVFTSPNAKTTYVSSADKTITAGNTTADCLVAATAPGIVGNIPSGVQFTVSPQPSGLVSAANQAAFSNGADVETDDQRKARFNEYIATLQRGTVEAVRFGTKKYAFLTNSDGVVTEKAKFVAVIEPWEEDNTQPTGLVNVFIHNGVGSTSGSLVTMASNVIYGYTDADGTKVAGWKAAGVNVVVAAAPESTLDIAYTLTPSPGYVTADLETSVNDVLNSYLLGLDIGGTFEVSEMYRLARGVTGVANFVPANVAPPAAPTLSSVTSGALAGATYYVKVTYVNAAGETLASSEHSLVVAANHVVKVTSPAAKAEATGWNVYVSTTAGTETKQNVAITALGTDWQEPNSGLIAGAALPATSTAEMTDVTAAETVKIMPGTIAAL